jgi:hypothetical protein
MAEAKQESSPPHLYDLYTDVFEENLHIHNPTRDLVLQRRREHARINIEFYKQLQQHPKLHKGFKKDWDDIQTLPIPYELKQTYRTRLITKYKGRINFVYPPMEDK